MSRFERFWDAWGAWVFLLALVACGTGFYLWAEQRSAAREVERARVEALEAKVFGNVENYAKAYPLLDKERAVIVERAVNARIARNGFSAREAPFAGQSPQRKLTLLREASEAADAAAAALDAARARDMARCLPTFGKDCETIISSWYCLRGDGCDEGALEVLEEQADDYDVCRDQIEDACSDLGAERY